MSTWIHIINWIIRTIRIQVQPVPAVGVLLGKSRYDRVVESCTQIVLLGDGIVLLSVEAEAVLNHLLTDGRVSPCVVLIMIEYLVCTHFMGATHYVGDATHLVGCIVVVGSCTLSVGCDQVVAADVADDAAVFLLCDYFIATEDELYKPAVLFHLVPQSLRIVAVDLHMPVEGLYFLCAVECIIGISSFIVLQQVSGIVIGELCRHSPFRILGQAVPRVIFIELLYAFCNTLCAVARPVIVQFLRV